MNYANCYINLQPVSSWFIWKQEYNHHGLTHTIAGIAKHQITDEFLKLNIKVLRCIWEVLWLFLKIHSCFPYGHLFIMSALCQETLFLQHLHLVMENHIFTGNMHSHIVINIHCKWLHAAYYFNYRLILKY